MTSYMIDKNFWKLDMMKETVASPYTHYPPSQSDPLMVVKLVDHRLTDM